MNVIKKEHLLIIFLSFLIFFSKWFISYWNFGFEDVFTKIIFNPSGDYSYYPFVKQLSELNFSEGYSTIFRKLDFIGFPFLVSIFHAIFYKIFGLYGFILLEFIFISLFLLIFFLIFKELRFPNLISVLLSLTFYSIPQFLYILDGLSIPYVFNLKQLYTGFYSLRFPRPLVTNIFLFSFFLFFIKFYVSENIDKSKKYFYFCAILIGLQFNSFFYFSLVSFISAIVLFYLKIRTSISIKEILKTYIIFFTIFFIFCLPFLIQLLLIEVDYFNRVGSYNIDSENKVFLFNHLILGFQKIEFIALLFLNIFLYLYNIKNNILSKRVLDVFSSIFLFSILTPFFYLVFFKTITFFSNFIFIIIISGFILFKINILIFLKNSSFFKDIKTFILVPLFFFLLLINLSYFYKTHDLKNLSAGVHFSPKNEDTFRKDFHEITNYIKINNKTLNKESLLLSNDVHIQTWWIFSDYKFFYFPYVFYTSLNDDMVEVQLINAFKYLGLNEEDFINFFNENKISNWRVVNSHNYFFLGHLKYQANYLKSFSNISNYPKKIQNFILKKSIHHTNQVILPDSEIERLKNKFRNTKINIKLKPSIIILNKNDFLTKKIVNDKNYCTTKENNNFVIIMNRSNLVCG